MTGAGLRTDRNLLLNDHSPAAIARMKRTHDAMTAIDRRAGNTPSERDCRDMDALMAALR